MTCADPGTVAPSVKRRPREKRHANRLPTRPVWVIKGDDPVEAGIHKEIRIELALEDHAADEEQLIICVSVDADDEPAGDIAATIGAVIDKARAEGREPTKE